MVDFLLKEDGGFLLQEIGDKIILETSVVTIFSKVSKSDLCVQTESTSNLCVQTESTSDICM